MADQEDNADTISAIEYLKQNSRDQKRKETQRQARGGNAGRSDVNHENINRAVQRDAGRGNANHRNVGRAVQGNAGDGNANHRNVDEAVQGNAGRGNVDRRNVDGAVQGNAGDGNANHRNVDEAVQGNADRGNLDQGNFDGENPGGQNLVPDIGPGGGRGDGRVAGRPARAPWARRISPGTLMLATAAGCFLLALFYRTADAPHSPKAQSRPEVTWAIGASRVAAVAAPLFSAVTYGRYLHALLTASVNVLTAPIDALRIDLGEATANMSGGTEALKARMLADSDAGWLHLHEMDEYVYMDIENAWFFQPGNRTLGLKLLPRRGVYFAMLWAGIPSPEPPERTARRRAGELIAYLDAGVSASQARLAEYKLLRHTTLEKMESELAYHAPKMQHDGRPRDVTQKERDAAAATSVISELMSRAKDESKKQDHLFYDDKDIFDEMKKELNSLSKALSPTNSEVEGPWARVFKSGARGLEALVRLEELIGAIRWILAEVDAPQP